MTSDLSIVQTLYLPQHKNPLSNSLGFLAPEFNWMSWALSCLSLRKLYDNVELYTNKAGKEVLIDILNLPYTKVNVVLDDLDFPPSIWAYAKLYTYSLQKKAFIHVDGDVFIWEKFKEPDSEAPLIVQNIEHADHYYKPAIHQLIKERFVLPQIIQNEIIKSTPCLSINAGIIGGIDLDFFRDYTSQAFNFIKTNIEKIPFANPFKFNMIFEQYLFYCLARQKNIQLKTQLNEAITDMTYTNSFNMSEVPYQTKYIHMVGDYKTNIEANILLAKRLRQNYPDYYYHIISQCKDSGIIPFFNYYKDSKTGYHLPENHSFSEKNINWDKLYKTEQEQQQLLEQTFNHLDNLNNSCFQINKLISKPTSQPSNSKTYYKVPSVYLMAFKEIECEEFDEALIELLKHPISFKSLFNKVKQWFDRDEVDNEEDTLFELIRLKLRNGCVSNLFNIV